MKQNKTSKLAVRLEPKEKKLLNYYANRLGISPSAIVRNQIKSLLTNLEEQLSDTYYTNVAEMNAFSGPNFSQDEIEKLFEVDKE
jgi:predicted DNA-binding protein